MSEEESTRARELAVTDPNAPIKGGREYGLAVLRGLIGAIPYAGALMNEVVFEARARLKQQRLEKLVSEIAEDLKAVDQSVIDQKFMKSDEFSDLVEDIFLRAMRTRSDEKRRYLKNTIVRAIQGIRPPSFSQLFLNLLDEISEEELGIYRAIVGHVQQAGKEKRDIEPIDYEKGELGIKEIQLRQVLQSLIRKGLVFDDSHHRLSTPPFKFIKATELGIAFLSWIDRP